MKKDEMSRAAYDRIGRDIVYFPDKPPLDYWDGTPRIDAWLSRAPTWWQRLKARLGL